MYVHHCLGLTERQWQRRRAVEQPAFVGPCAEVSVNAAVRPTGLSGHPVAGDSGESERLDEDYCRRQPVHPRIRTDAWQAASTRANMLV